MQQEHTDINTNDRHNYREWDRFRFNRQRWETQGA